MHTSWFDNIIQQRNIQILEGNSQKPTTSVLNIQTSIKTLGFCKTRIIFLFQVTNMHNQPIIYLCQHDTKTNSKEMVDHGYHNSILNLGTEIYR
jgi:hypothetical protein